MRLFFGTEGNCRICLSLQGFLMTAYGLGASTALPIGLPLKVHDGQRWPQSCGGWGGWFQGITLHIKRFQKSHQ
ncbi:rCG33031 [Rattus norvegicus]|uniref:RCG33031 n=1 Tax=Rattus norvegicus TaxID=10116 RepID=A6HEI8_RAT|nr:rCG33031 [Rattus norvegicus]